MKRKVLSSIGRLLAGVLLLTCLPLQSFATNSSADTAVVTNGKLVFEGTFDVKVLSGDNNVGYDECGVASTLTGKMVLEGLSDIEGAEFVRDPHTNIHLPGLSYLDYQGVKVVDSNPYDGILFELTEDSRSRYDLSVLRADYNSILLSDVTGYVSGTLEDGTKVRFDLKPNVFASNGLMCWGWWEGLSAEYIFPATGDEPEPGTPEYFIAEYNESTETAAEDIKELAKTVTSPTVVEFKGGDALPQNIMTEVKSSDKITLEFPFSYEGVDYICRVTPDKAKLYVKDDIPWYGPLYLMQYFDVTKV